MSSTKQTTLLNKFTYLTNLPPRRLFDEPDFGTLQPDISFKDHAHNRMDLIKQMITTGALENWYRLNFPKTPELKLIPFYGASRWISYPCTQPPPEDYADVFLNFVNDIIELPFNITPEIMKLTRKTAQVIYDNRDTDSVILRANAWHTIIKNCSHTCALYNDEISESPTNTFLTHVNTFEVPYSMQLKDFIRINRTRLESNKVTIEDIDRPITMNELPILVQNVPLVVFRPPRIIGKIEDLPVVRRNMSEKMTKEERKITKVNVEKNFAPIDPRINTLDKNDAIVKTDKEKNFERQQLRKEKALHTSPSDYMAVDKTFADVKARKIRNRRGYALRYVTEKPKIQGYMSAMYDITPQERLKSYNSHNKCRHNRGFNVVEKVIFENKLIGFKATCDHPNFNMVDSFTKCKNCGATSQRLIEDRCSCVVYLCTRCKTQTYEGTSLSCCCRRSGNPLAGSDYAKWMKQHVITKPGSRKKWNKKEQQTDLPTVLPENNFPTLGTETPTEKRDWKYTLPPKVKPNMNFDKYTHQKIPLVNPNISFSPMTFIKPITDKLKDLKDKMINTTIDFVQDELKFKISLMITRMIDYVKRIFLRLHHKIYSLRLTDVGIHFAIGQLLDSKDLSSIITNIFIVLAMLPEESESDEALKQMQPVPKTKFEALTHVFCHANANFAETTYSMAFGYEAAKWIYTTLQAPTISFFNLLRATPNSFGGTSALLEGFCSLFGVCGKTITHFTKFVKDFNTIFTGGRNLKSIVANLVDFLPTCISALFTCCDPKHYLNVQYHDKTSTFRRLLDQIVIIQYQTVHGRAPTDARAAANLLLGSFKVEISNTRWSTDSHIMRTIKSLRETIDAPFAPGPRDKEPFVIKVSSSAGAGKSTMWPALISSLYPTKSIDEILDISYVRNPKSDFWDGLKVDKTEIVVYDDAFQFRDENEIPELILLCTRSMFLPPFSTVDSTDIGRKGTSFAPKFVVLLTNVPELKATTIHEPEAINRRRHIHIHVDQVKSGAPRQPDLSHLEFKYTSGKKRDGTTANATEETRTHDFFEVQDEILAQYELYLKANEQIVETLDNLCYKNRKNVNPRAKSSKWTHERKQPEGYRLGERDGKYVDDSIRHEPLPEDIQQVIEDDLGNFTPRARFNAGYFVPGAEEDILYYSNYDLSESPFMTTLYMTYCQTSDYVIKALKIGLSIGLVIGWIMGMRAFLKWLMPRPDLNSGESNMARTTVPIAVVNSGDQDIITKIGNNMARVRRPNIGFRTVGALFVEGRTILLNKHFLLHLERDGYMEEGEEIMIEFANTKGPTYFKFEQNRIKQLEGVDKDLVLYRLPVQIPARPTITQHFWEGEQSLKNRNVAATPISIDPEEGLLRVNYHYGKIVNDHKEVRFPTDWHTNDTTTHSMASSNLNLHQGQCGTPVIMTGNNTKIVSIHSADLLDTSLSFMATQKMIKDALKYLDDKFPEAKRAPKVETNMGYTFSVTSDDVIEANLPDGLMLVGKLDTPLANNTKTKIRKSPLYGQISEPTTRPVILNPKDSRLTEDIYRMQQRKFTHDAKSFDKDLVALAAKSILEELESIDTVDCRRALTIDEAINGIPNMPFIKSLDLSTASGFPFTLGNKRGAKSKLIKGEVGDKLIVDDELRRMVNNRIESLKRREIPNDAFWIDTLKDERRTHKKVLEGKTRLFTASSAHYIIVGRMFNLGFCSKLMQCATKCFSSIGINRASLQWDINIRRHLEVGNTGFAGDYQNWDGSVVYETLEAAYGIIDAWYGDENSIIRQTLAQETGQAYHVFEKWIYGTTHSLPSGIDVTSIVNTLVNEINMRVAWMSVMPIEKRSLFNYRKMVRTSIYGDDNMVTVRGDCLEQFNSFILRDFFKEYNITYTAAVKHEELKKYEPLLDLSFLKQKTGMLGPYYVPLMSDEDNFETINWIRQHEFSTPDELTEANCNDVLRNLFFHGRDRFNELRNHILELKPKYLLIDYASLFTEFMGMGTLSDPLNQFGFTRRDC